MIAARPSNAKARAGMRVLIATSAMLAACVLSASCGGDKAPASSAPPSPAFTLVDTIPSDSVGRPSALLKRDGVVIDTADVAFGIQTVGRDSILYLATGASHGHTYKLFHDGSKTPINTIVPDFDDALSAPSVIANAVLYWGIHSTNGIDSVRAVRYEFPRKRLNPLPISAKVARADPAFRFRPPFLDGKEIVFKASDGEWRFRTPKQR